jgi:hypothetical protein
MKEQSGTDFKKQLRFNASAWNAQSRRFAHHPEREWMNGR